ncbi:hypothetical protein HN924_02870 [Candidatus Woesearchaeota archaeon]|nr:hypothetical protein [Candidatus Woesearchaeota archaeon]MBT7402710.1 hypothetical protein [Candidatus Woesearchaeota archaeon]
MRAKNIFLIFLMLGLSFVFLANTVTAEKYVIGTDSLAGTGYNNFYHLNEPINFCGKVLKVTEIHEDYVSIYSEDSDYIVWTVEPGTGTAGNILRVMHVDVINLMYKYEEGGIKNPNDVIELLREEAIYRVPGADVYFEVSDAVLDGVIPQWLHVENPEDETMFLGVELEFDCWLSRYDSEPEPIDSEPVTISGACVEDGTRKGCHAYDKTNGYTENDCSSKIVYTELAPTGVNCKGDVDNCWQKNSFGNDSVGSYLACNSETFVYNEYACNIQPGCMWISLDDYDFSKDCIDVVEQIVEPKNRDNDLLIEIGADLMDDPEERLTCVGENSPEGAYSCSSLSEEECNNVNSKTKCYWHPTYRSCKGVGSCSSLKEDMCDYFVGKGCKLFTPESESTCRNNVDCECGEICSAGECGAYAGPEIGHCDSDEECLGGYDCVHGECIENAKCYPGGKFSAASGATGYPVYIGIGAIVLVAGFWYYIDSTKKKPKRRKSKRKRRK